MLKTPELAMPRSRKITTVCNGKREVWTDYEDAKSYFLEMMMSTDGEEHDRAECVYIRKRKINHRFPNMKFSPFVSVPQTAFNHQRFSKKQTAGTSASAARFISVK